MAVVILGAEDCKKLQTPQEGPTGSKVIACELTIESGNILHHYLRPGPPSRIVSTWDEDDVEYQHELTDEEFAAAEERYKKAAAEWDRTGGAFVEAGRERRTCKVSCEDGCQAEAMWTGEEWCWTSYYRATKLSG